jgi:hypothetical protein
MFTAVHRWQHEMRKKGATLNIVALWKLWA